MQNLDSYGRMLVSTIPGYNIPQIKEAKTNGGYLTFGDDNLFPEYLLKLFYGSSLHNAIILRKVDEIVGNGLYSALNNPQVENWISKVNSSGQSLNDLFRKICMDMELFNGFTLQIIYGKGSTAKKPIIAELRYVDITKFRKNLTGDKLLYARDWSMIRVKTIEYDLFDLTNPVGNQIFYYSGNMTREQYPIPTYIGSLGAIETAIEISNLHLNAVKSGFFPSMLIDFKNGEPTEEQKKSIERDLKAKFGGTSNSGKFILSFSDKDNPGPTINKIDQPDLDKLFITTQDSVMQNIFQGHRVTNPSIFGIINSSGKLGNSAEYSLAYNIWQNTYIKPQQKILLNIINNILSIDVKEPDLQILPVEPLGNVFSDEMLIASCMTISEVRSKLVEWGYIPSAELEEGEKVLGISNLKPAPNKKNDATEPENSVVAPNETENA